MTETHQTARFGDRPVALEDKQGLVNGVFRNVASRYDLMNDLMSGGVHRAWKDALVARLAPPKSGARTYRVLDMAGGTGDIAERILRASSGFAEIVVADINPDMLEIGRARARKWRFGSQVSFIEANAEDLAGIEDDSFDAYTIAFGIRNVPRMQQALEEAHRVLKPGGRLLILEFSSVDVPWFDRLYEIYSSRFIPPLGRIVTGDREAYQYLIESIRAFPKPQSFVRLIAEAGFKRVTHTAFTGNIAALFGAWKL